MKLWLLRANDGLPKDEDPWEPWYDKNFGFIVRAASEEDARAITSANSRGDEMRKAHDAWTNPRYSTCLELTADGEAEVIMSDFNAA
jgi:hypothetical protein